MWCSQGKLRNFQHSLYMMQLTLAYVQGVQFHPESIITDNGMSIMNNFLRSL